MDESYTPIDISVHKIALSDTETTDLSTYIRRELDSAASDRAELEREWANWIDQYRGRLKRQDRTDDWQADIDIPTTRTRANQAASRMINPIVQEDRLYVSAPRKPEFDDLSKSAEAFLDYQADQWAVERVLYELVRSAMIFKYGVLKDDWETDTRVVTSWKKPEPMPLDMSMNMPAGMSNGMNEMPMGIPGAMSDEMGMVETTEPVCFFEGVRPTVVNVEDFYFPADSPADLEDAAWVAEVTHVPKHVVKQRIRDGIYQDVSIADLSSWTDESDVRDKRLDAAGVEQIESRPYSIVEWYGLYDGFGDGNPQEIVVHMDRGSGKILSANANHRHRFKRPYLAWAWEQGQSLTGGDSLCEILEPIHRAISAYTVQRLEAASLANGVAIITTDQELASKFKDRRIMPGEVVYCTSLDGWKELKLSQPISELGSLIAELERNADKLVGLNDYSFGVEQIDRPTATGQTALIEEGKQPLYEKLNSLRVFLGQLAIRILSRYRQFWPGGLKYYRMLDDGSLEALFMQFPDGLIEDQLLIEPKASSANLNDNVRKQEMVALLEQMKGFYQLLQPILQQALMPGPPMLVALKQANAAREMMNRVLDAFKVPRPEAINPDFTQEVFGGLQMAMAQMQAQVQAGGVPGMGAEQLPPGAGPGPGEARPTPPQPGVS